MIDGDLVAWDSSENDSAHNPDNFLSSTNLFSYTVVYTSLREVCCDAGDVLFVAITENRYATFSSRESES